MSYQGCTCKDPKKLKNEANGQAFYVCAKSQGGCGKEIGKQLSISDMIHASKSIQADRAEFWINGQKVGEITNISISPNCKISHVDDEEEKERECEECGGAGFTAKLYPSGHTEATCEECDGKGVVYY